MELKLTKAQISRIRNDFKPGMVIKLTPAQQTKILESKQLKFPPTRIELWKPANLEQDCTCFLWNIGLIVKPDLIELPISRLCSDKEAKDNRTVAD